MSKKWFLCFILNKPPMSFFFILGLKFSKYFWIWFKLTKVAPLNKGSWPFGVFIKWIQFIFFSTISSKNSGIYFWLSLIISLQNIKYLEKKIKSLGFLDKGKPLLSKKTFTSVSSSLIPVLKFSLYSLNTSPVRIIAVKISIFFERSFSNLIFLLTKKLMNS